MMKSISILLLLCGSLTAQPLPSVFKFAPLSNPVFKDLVRINPTSSGSQTLLTVGNTDSLEDYSGGFGTYGALSVRASTIFGAQIHSSFSNGLVASSFDGQAAKFIQKNQSYGTTDVPVVRIFRGVSAYGGYVSSPILTLNDTTPAGSGGSAILIKKENVVIFEVDSSGRPVLRAPNGTRWVINVSNTGALSTTSAP